MPDDPGVPRRPDRSRARNWKKGTRALRWRTLGRAGLTGTGQPRVDYDPVEKPQGNPPKHVCAECFGPRSAYRRGFFCTRCERALFGNENAGYESFIRSQRKHMSYVRKRWAATGYIPPE